MGTSVQSRRSKSVAVWHKEAARWPRHVADRKRRKGRLVGIIKSLLGL